MLVPLPWLVELVPALAGEPAEQIAHRFTAAGLNVERIHRLADGVAGVVVGRVEAVEELTGFRKPVRFCQLDTGEGEPRGIVCGATNFAAGDLVTVALPGARLPGLGEISARRTYGHTSEGMICSARELGLGDDHSGILVLGRDAEPGADVATLTAAAVLELEVTPDRGYCLAMRGIAREAAALAGVPFTDPAAAVFDAQSPTLTGLPAAAGRRLRETPDGAAWPVVVEDTEGCDRYLALTVTGVDPAAVTPVGLRLRLLAAGMRPVSLSVDVTNAVMLGLGQPLHAFDRAALRGALRVRRAHPGERLVTLDGVDRALHPADLVIADDEGVLALAGVMGGSRAEIGPQTVDVVLESAHFDAVTIARSARRHRLASEAARRYERGVDPALGQAAAWAAARLLVDLAGAEPGGVTEIDHRRPAAVVLLPAGQVSRLGGREVSPEAVRHRLRQVGCLPEEHPDGWLVTPPPWRPDLRESVDLVEEVLRLEGFDAIPSRLPRPHPGRGLTRSQRRRRELSRALAAEGLVEVVSSPFTSADPLRLPADDPRRSAVRIANPLAADQAWLRTSLLPGLAAAVVHNRGRGTADVGVFEIGQVVFDRPAPPPGWPALPPAGRRPSPDELAALQQALPDQPAHVAALLAGDVDPAGWWGPGRAADWTDAVRTARAGLEAVGALPELAAGQSPPWHPGRCAELRVADRVVGYAGALHPRAVEQLGLPGGSVAFELDLSGLLDAAQPVVRAPLLGEFPAAVLDVALVVAAQVPQGRVAAALRSGGGVLVESVELFDVYRGAQVPADSVGLAYRLTLRAPDRTLAGEEASAARDAAVAAAARATGAQLRH